MNTTFDNPLLVAPRPVRLTSAPRSTSPPIYPRSHPLHLLSAAAEQLELVKLSDENDLNDSLTCRAYDSFAGTSDREMSPRASSRSSLPSEALEEFLSILRPSFMPPSPTRGRRAAGSASVPSHPYPVRHRMVHQKSEPAPSSWSGLEEIDRGKGNLSRNGRPTSASPDSAAEMDDDLGEVPFRDFDPLLSRWFTSSNLSSPISRMHTRNPFHRHPSYEYSSRSPSLRSPIPTPCSPSTVPLPPPTPSELGIIEVS